MAERQAARLLQPWLFSPSTSLSARQSLFTPSSLRIPPARTTTSTCATRSFSLQRPLNKQPVRRKPATARKSPYGRDQALPMSLDNVSVLVPMTFVPPPVSKWPRAPTQFLHTAYTIAKVRFINYLYLAIHKVYSRSGWRGPTLFKIRKGAIVPAARDLHARMNAAIAAGNKDELKRVCTQELYEKLSGIADSRPKGQSMKWELEGGKSKCSLRDDRIVMMPLTATENRTIRQAVVSVSSTQRIVTIDEKRGGVGVPGTAKTKTMRENIVLTAYVDPKTWQQAPWKIWGTLPDSTVQEYLDEVAAYNAMAADQANS